jgi:hypothetical protein
LIENKFYAPFKGRPSFTGEMGEARIRGYNYIDESNFVFYSAVYQVNKTPFKKSDIIAALGNWVKGNAMAVSGSVLSQTYAGNYVDYVIQYNPHGYLVNKFARVIYNDGQFFQWSVQETVGLTPVSAKDIFVQNVSRFSLKK